MKNVALAGSRFLTADDPFEVFDSWYEEAKLVVAPEPSAMTLSTVDREGRPSSRVVLMKDFDQNGFVFFTNLMSHKGRDLQRNRNVALSFYWPPLARQVRITGIANRVSDKEADAYFATRPRGSQIAAWASSQSSVLTDRKAFEERQREYAESFEGRPVPRPDFWSGFRVEPTSMEFWQAREFRTHDRVLYTRQAGVWKRQLLYP